MSTNSRRVRRSNNGSSHRYNSERTINSNKSLSKSILEDDSFSFSLGDTLRGVKPKPTTQQRDVFKNFKNYNKALFYAFLALIFLLVIRQLPLFLSSHDTNTSSTPLRPSRKGRQDRQQQAPNMMIPKPGEYAPLVHTTDTASTKQNLKALLKPPTNEYHVFILGSEQDVPTIRLSNIILGLFETSESFLAVTKWSVVGSEYLTRHQNQWVHANVTTVSLVVGETDVTQLLREFRPQYSHLFFILLYTKGTKETCASPLQNIMACIEPSMVAHTNEVNGISNSVKNVIQVIQQQLPYFSKIQFDFVEALRRTNAMEEMMIQMQDMPSTSSDIKYGVYGASKGGK